MPFSRVNIQPAGRFKKEIITPLSPKNPWLNWFY